MHQFHRFVLGSMVSLGDGPLAQREGAVLGQLPIALTVATPACDECRWGSRDRLVCGLGGEGPKYDPSDPRNCRRVCPEAWMRVPSCGFWSKPARENNPS